MRTTKEFHHRKHGKHEKKTIVERPPFDRVVFLCRVFCFCLFSVFSVCSVVKFLFVLLDLAWELAEGIALAGRRLAAVGAMHVAALAGWRGLDRSAAHARKLACLPRVRWRLRRSLFGQRNLLAPGLQVFLPRLFGDAGLR